MSVGLLVSQHQKRIDRELDESARIFTPRSRKEVKVSHIRKLDGDTKDSPKGRTENISNNKFKHLVNFGVGRLGETRPLAKRNIQLGLSTNIYDGESMFK